MVLNMMDRLMDVHVDLGHQKHLCSWSTQWWVGDVHFKVVFTFKYFSTFRTVNTILGNYLISDLFDWIWMQSYSLKAASGFQGWVGKRTAPGSPAGVFHASSFGVASALFQRSLCIHNAHRRLRSQQPLRSPQWKGLASSC